MTNPARAPEPEMIHIKQHVPTFVDGTPKEATVSTQEELLAIPWIADYREDEPGRAFYRFSLSGHQEASPLLMVEKDEGRHWWVVGYVTEGAELLTLPRWEPRS